MGKSDIYVYSYISVGSGCFVLTSLHRFFLSSSLEGKEERSEDTPYQDKKNPPKNRNRTGLYIGREK